MKKIAAGKAFFMQSKHVSVNYLLLTRIRSSPGAFPDLPRNVSDAAAFYLAKEGSSTRRSSGLSMLRPNIRCKNAKAKAQKALQERLQICLAACPMPPHSTGPRRGAQRRRSSSLSMLRPDIRCPLETS